jgi:hypothetical protein
MTTFLLPLCTLWVRRGSAVAAQGVVISFCDGLGSLAEHRGGDFSSQPRQGQKDGLVTMLTRWSIAAGGEFLQEGVHTSGDMDTRFWLP